jgi:hypothetical protein
MSIFLFVLKIICLFLSILSSISITCKLIARNTITGSMVMINALGLTGFITLQWLV